MDQVKAGSGSRIALLAMLLGFPVQAREEAKSILVLHPKGESFEEAKKGLRESLGPDYAVEEFVFGRGSGIEDVEKAWRSSAPKVVVAMDNKGLALAKDAREGLRDSIVPIVGLMGVRVDASLRGVPNSLGINYEIPAVTTLVNLRSILPRPIRKTGVIYRASMEDLYRRNAEFCRQEGFELVGIEVPDASDARASLDRALKELAGRDDVDALWVLNDNFFLNARLIVGSWQPGLSGWKRPVVVGIETLVKPAFRFGTFAVLPDNYALGAQAAELVQEIEDAGWLVQESRVDQPLSVVKTLNLPGTRKCCGIDDGKLGEVDKVLE